MSSKLLVDGHVHFHRCFTWNVFLEAAAAHFSRARSELDLGLDSPGCLMFTESAGINAFAALAGSHELLRESGWRIESVDDDAAIVLRRLAGESLIAIAGRQIVTSEGLEVLALGCARELPDHQPIRAVLRSVADSLAVAVVPWGFGKWWGTRGRIVRDLIENPPAAPFCLGDNGGRSGTLPAPALFDYAIARGILVLGGSDPLPLPAQVTRPGSYGFVLDGWDSASPPASAITERLRSLHNSPPSFGALSSIPAMVRAQVALQWRRRFGLAQAA